MANANRIYVNTGTTGTGTLTLGAVVSAQFVTFANAGIADGATVRSYILEEGSDFEIGTGVYGSAGPSLTRTVRKSCIGGVVGTTKMTLAGTATVRVIAAAEDIVDPANNLSDLASKYTAMDNLSIHGADIASAATLNLEAATGNLVDVTGTTTVTAITLSEGHERTVRFTGALTLTNGASLVLPGGANIVTASGDFAIFKGYAAGVVRCVSYQKASGKPIAASVVVRSQRFASSGTYTPDANLLYAVIEAWGAGGGGGGTAGTASQTKVAGGGGGGSYSRTIASAATIGASQTVTIGAGGAGGAAGANVGIAGGDTSVGTLCIGKGGSGGPAGGYSPAGTAGGGAGTGDFTSTGATSGSAVGDTTGAMTLSVGAVGASSAIGGGGAGGTGFSSAAAGAPAAGFASGGGGSSAQNSTGTAAGGAGSPGLVFITEYCSK